MYTKRTFLNMLYVCILKEKRDIISFIFPFAQPPTPERPRREYTTSENDEMRTTARESNELPNRKRNKRPRKTQNKKRAAHLTSTRKLIVITFRPVKDQTEPTRGNERAHICYYEVVTNCLQKLIRSPENSNLN